MNMKAICIALIACLFFAGTAMAYATVLQVKLNTASGGVTQIGCSTAVSMTSVCPTGTWKWCMNVWDPINSVWVANAQKGDASAVWVVGDTKTTLPITLTTGNLYGIRIGYYKYYTTACVTGNSIVYIPSTTATPTGSDFLWFTA